MDGIKSVIDIVKDVGPSAWKYVKYQLYHHDYVNEFNEVQEKLRHRLNDINAILRTQLMQPGKIANVEVVAWLELADQGSTEIGVEDLICKGGCFTYICLSRKLDERTQALHEIFMHGEKYTNPGLSLVIDDHSIKGVHWGRYNIPDQILHWLKGDKVTRIAVWGMGGVGKTTIMKQVHNQLLKEPKFDKVIWVKMSKDFDIIVQKKVKFDILKFQKRIANSLELKLEPGDHMNETKLAGLISQNLRQGSYVLILDDVWQPFCLEDVGIPDLEGNNVCKLVFTTRLQHVAHAIACEVIPMNPLPPDDALELFLEKVGSDVLSNGGIKADIEPFLEQILQKCDGVPLAIVMVAKLMREKLDPHSWRWALSTLSNSEGIVDCLKFSYDCLESPCQKCFLYCALYPEDYEIPTEELIERWIEEGFINKEGETRDEMNCEGQVMLKKLVDNSLLELVENRMGEDCVTMHDLLREMALDISPQFLVKAGMGLEELPEQHEWRKDLLKVSLMKNYIREIPSSMSYQVYPMLATLLLSDNKISTIPEAFFEHMPGLKILDLSNNPELNRLPSSVSKLEKLTTLLLGGCWCLRVVPSLSNLGGLKKLDLSKTSIEELPHGLERLTKFKRFKIFGCNKIKKLFSLRLLGYLEHVETIEVGFCEQMVEIISFSHEEQGEAPEKFTLPKLERMKFHGLRALKRIYSGSSSLMCDSIKSIEIEDCKSIVSVFSSVFNPLPTLELLFLRDLDNLNGLCEVKEPVAKSGLLPVGTFSSLKMKIFCCNKIKKLFPLRMLGNLQNLETIAVRFCVEIEEIISSEYEEDKALKKITLPKLESLELQCLPQLKSIYNGSSAILTCDSIKRIKIEKCNKIESVFWSGFNPLPTLEYVRLQYLENLKSLFDEEALGLLAPPITFFSLKTISVSWCPKLKKLFSSGRLLGYFQHLETIQVRSCYQMEELVSSPYEEEKGAQTEVTLPKLEWVTLCNLPEFKSICSGSSVLIV